MNNATADTHFAHLLEVHNAIADVMHTYKREGLLSVYRKPQGNWGLWLTEEWPGPPEYSAAMTAIAEEHDVLYHLIQFDGKRSTIEVQLIPLLVELGLPFNA